MDSRSIASSPPRVPRLSPLPPLPSPTSNRLARRHPTPTPPPDSRYPSPLPPPDPPFLHPPIVPASSAPDPSHASIALVPVRSDAPLPKPANATLPSLRELFSPFPPELPPKIPDPAKVIPEISTLFAMLVPDQRQQAPLSDNVGDQSIRIQVCATCGNPNPSMACPKCRVVHYCNHSPCYTQDVDHASVCVQLCNYISTVDAQPYNHIVRLELVKVAESMYRRQRTLCLLHLAIWHGNELIRLPHKRDPLGINLQFPFFLLRTGENDAVVSFIRYWAKKTSRTASEAEQYIMSTPGNRTYPVDINRYEDALAEGFPQGTVPLTHLVALCLVKLRILASINVRWQDARRKKLWESNFGKKLSVAAGERLEDFLLRGGRPQETAAMQRSMLTKYLLLIRERNPIMEHAIRDIRTMQNPVPDDRDTAFSEAQQIWDAIGYLFMQLPQYTRYYF